MTIGAKILAVLASLCVLAWVFAIVLGVQPIVPATELEVLYGVHEDFHADGAVFRKLRNRTFYIVHLPQATPGRQWWTIDFQDLVITDALPLRSLGGARFVLEGDLDGTPIAGDERTGIWRWHFTGDSVSFAGRSLTCKVRRTVRY